MVGDAHILGGTPCRVGRAVKHNSTVENATPPLPLFHQKLATNIRKADGGADYVFAENADSGCKSARQTVYLMYRLKRSMTFVGFRAAHNIAWSPACASLSPFFLPPV